MHPLHRPLSPDIEAIWLAAVPDAGLDAGGLLLCLVDGESSPNGNAGLHFGAGERVADDDLGLPPVRSPRS
jgi:hypothetical protein